MQLSISSNEISNFEVQFCISAAQIENFLLKNPEDRSCCSLQGSYIMYFVFSERIAHSNALRLHRCTITGCGKVRSYSLTFICTGLEFKISNYMYSLFSFAVLFKLDKNRQKLEKCVISWYLHFNTFCVY